jgi:hypothetical protein
MQTGYAVGSVIGYSVKMVYARHMQHKSQLTHKLHPRGLGFKKLSMSMTKGIVMC